MDGRVFNIGIQTGRALGNGSLMRVLPLALWHQGGDAELVADAAAQSRVTHEHLRAQVCCALYCLWARRTLEEASDPWAAAVSGLRAIFFEGAREREEPEWSIRPDDSPAGDGSGYVVATLRSAR